MASKRILTIPLKHPEKGLGNQGEMRYTGVGTAYKEVGKRHGRYTSRGETDGFRRVFARVRNRRSMPREAV